MSNLFLEFLKMWWCFRQQRELVLQEQHTNTVPFSATLPQVAHTSACHLSPIFSTKITNSLKKVSPPILEKLSFYRCNTYKNQAAYAVKCEKGLSVVTWLIMQKYPASPHTTETPGHLIWDVITVRDGGWFYKFQRARVLTHTRLITTPDSLQVSMRSLQF